MTPILVLPIRQCTFGDLHIGDLFFYKNHVCIKNEELVNAYDLFVKQDIAVYSDEDVFYAELGVDFDSD